MAASSGVKLKIVLLLDYTVGSDGVVAKNNIASIQDLKGKRIGVEKGTIAHFTLLKFLEKAGLSLDEVNLKYYDLNSLQEAFLENKVDAVSLYEPYMSTLIEKGNGHLIFSSKEIPRSICDILFVKEDVVRKNPGLIDHWIASWGLAIKMMDHENYLENLSHLNGTPKGNLEESLKGIFFTNMAENNMAFGTKNKPGYLLESLKEMEDFMIEQNVLKKRLPLKSMIRFKADE